MSRKGEQEGEICAKEDKGSEVRRGRRERERKMWGCQL